jgi:hypothetical protein
MSNLKIIKGAKDQQANLISAYLALEPDICDMVRAAEIASLAEEHNEELVTFAIEQCLKTAEELKAKYYELYKGC